MNRDPINNIKEDDEKIVCNNESTIVSFKLLNAVKSNTTEAKYEKEGSKYKFLFKPIFFIFSLIFATCLVLYIENIAPSDFGRYESLFGGPKPKGAKANLHLINSHSALPKFKEAKLKKLFLDYRSGKMDSTRIDQIVEKYLRSTEEDIKK